MLLYSMLIKIQLSPAASAPQYKTSGASACDVAALLNESVTLPPLSRAAIPTGLYFELPAGYELQVRPRSGLALNSGVTVLNSPGTIDSDYRGELKVILINLSNAPYTIKNGDRIAQLVLGKVEHCDFQIVRSLGATPRGSGGFGSTGT